MAGIQAGLSQAKTTVIRHRVGSDRTCVTSRLNHLHDIPVVRILLHGLRTSQANPLSDNLSFLIYTAPVGWLRPRNHLINQPFPIVCRECALPGQSTDLCHNVMFKTHNTHIIGCHNFSCLFPAKSRLNCKHIITGEIIFSYIQLIATEHFVQSLRKFPVCFFLRSQL